MRVLGISAFYHDSAAALLVDGVPVAAAQEERFTRRKHDPRFPLNAIRYCLAEGGAGLDEVDLIAFYEKPLLKFERLLETYLSSAPRGYRSFAMALPIWLKDKLFQKPGLITALKPLSASGGKNLEAKLVFAEHHQSHAASAFFPSPFEEAVVLTMDGVGEWATTSVAVGRGDRLETVKEIQFPHSIGLLYSAFTYYTGFKVNSGEYKLMGLAPYGEPKYAGLIRDRLIDLKDDGSFWLDLSYFNYVTGLTMTSEKLHRLFGSAPRKPEERLEQRHMDIAASIQQVTEEIVLRLTRDLARTHAIPNLCLAGGVALNCVANGKVLRDKQFKRIWVQPAAGDAGGALGAAYAAHVMHAGKHVTRNGADRMSGSYLGPSFAQSEIEARLKKCGARFATLEEGEAIARTVDALVAGHAVGWFQGRMEFGPRALGARSILGDPRNPQMQRALNLKIKYRESFRPFAPAVLAEDAPLYFEIDAESPYMLMVADVQAGRRRKMTADEERLFGIEKLNIARSDIPAVTHVDYSARVQTVHRETNPRFHALISAFKAATGCAVLVNTSFNVRGEPIVHTPEDAFRCFMGTEMETLVVGNCFMRKDEQDASLAIDYKDKFELD